MARDPLAALRHVDHHHLGANPPVTSLADAARLFCNALQCSCASCTRGTTPEKSVLLERLFAYRSVDLLGSCLLLIATDCNRETCCTLQYSQKFGQAASARNMPRELCTSMMMYMVAQCSLRAPSGHSPTVKHAIREVNSVSKVLVGRRGVKVGSAMLQSLSFAAMLTGLVSACS